MASRFKQTKLDRAFYKKDRADLWEKQNRRCYYCHKRLSRHEITMDHVVPISHIKYHSISNCVVACEVCNAAKGNKTNWSPPVDDTEPLEEWEILLQEGLDRMEKSIREFEHRWDKNSMGSYNRWFKYWTKRHRWS